MATLLPIVEVDRREELADGTIRYYLNNGWFIDRPAHVYDRGGDGKYTLWLSGCGREIMPGKRIAAFGGNANRLDDILDLANRLHMG